MTTERPACFLFFCLMAGCLQSTNSENPVFRTRTTITQTTPSSGVDGSCLPLSFIDKSWIRKTPNVSDLWIHTALIEVFGRFNWPTVIVLYSRQYEQVVRQISDSSSFHGVKLLLFRVDNATNQTLAVNDILADVATLVDESHLNFLLLCDTDCVTTVLSVVNLFDAINLRRTAHWMFSRWLTLFPHKPFPGDISLNNVAVVVCPTATECRHSKVTSGCVAKPDIATLMVNDGRHSLLEVDYDVNGTRIPHGDVFPNSHCGFNKRKLLVATHVEYPFVTKTVVNGTVRFDGFCLDILNALAVILNFTYTMVEPPDGEWGRYVRGRWTGLVGLCQDRKVDLTIAPLTVAVDRSKVMDFAYPFYHDKLVAIYKMPDAAGSKWKTLLWPFRWEVFLSLALTCVIIVTMVYCVDRKLPMIVKDRSTARRPERHTVMESVLMVYAILLKQGSDFPPLSVPGRMVIGAFWLFTILIAAAYCGNLVAFLTIKKDIQPLKTLADLVSQSQYTWGTIGGTFWMTLFEFSNKTDDQKIWDGLVRFNKTDRGVLAPHFPEHRKKVETGNYVFFSERSVLRMWSEDTCDLVFLEQIFYKANFAIGFPLNSPYTRRFSQAMVELEQNGLLQLWERTRWRSHDKCISGKQAGARVIGLVDLQSAFFVLVMGLISGLVIILLEWFWKRKLQKE